MLQAAIYCRSSKDRAEMGLPAQRQELTKFARGSGFEIIDEFSDMEVSGSLDEASRPGLRALLAALRAPTRKWSHILALDTSRIARDPELSLYVTREAEKHGVHLHYAKIPLDGSTAFGEAMLNVLRGFDRLHARLSSEKGRSGLLANIAAGFRAGGIAPLGYKLKRHKTGGMRAGQPVTKSTLAVDPAAARKVQVFLKERAQGIVRSAAAHNSGLQHKHAASLIAIEKNALTYAGYTVWNARRKTKPTMADERTGMTPRPREEWVISEKPTHQALITRAEAERILASHEFKPRQPRVVAPDKFVLSGLMFTPDGKQWHGDAHDSAYRAGAKGKRINAPYIEGEILFHVACDFADKKFLARTVAEARRMAGAIEDDPKAIEGVIRKTERQLNNLIGLAADEGDVSILAKIRELESTLTDLREQQAAWEGRRALKESLLKIEEKDLRGVLAATALKLRGDDAMVLNMLGVPDKAHLKQGELRRVLTALVDRIELDPVTREFKIHYRLPVPLTGVRMASPQGISPDSGSILITSTGRFSKRAPRRSSAVTHRRLLAVAASLPEYPRLAQRPEVL